MKPGHPKRFYFMRLAAPFISPLPVKASTFLRLSGSDKEREGGHRYGEAYDRLFGRIKYKPIRLLEIGIGGHDYHLGGESLSAWACYFPFGNVIGCDIEDRRALNGGRIRTYRVDQSSAEDLVGLAKQEGPFDVIIDDGSHINSHQIFSFETLFPYIKSGGIYVIEDVQTSYWSDHGGRSVCDQDSSTCMGYFSQLIHYLNYEEFRNSANVDERFLSFARRIGRIHFEHNLIAIEIK